MEWLMLLGSAGFGGLLTLLFNRKKTGSETRLNEVKAMQELFTEAKNFYNIKIETLEQEIEDLKKEIQCLRNELSSLRRGL